MNKKETKLVQFLFSNLLIISLIGCGGKTQIKPTANYKTTTTVTSTASTVTTNKKTYAEDKSLIKTSSTDYTSTSKYAQAFMDKKELSDATSHSNKNEIMQTASLVTPKAIIYAHSNDLLLDQNRFVVLKSVSSYFGERKIKSVIYAVGDFNAWGKDKVKKYPVRVENDEAKLDLYQLPLLKGSNRIGFSDYDGNIWKIKEDLQKNRVMTQSNNGDWVIGIIVTQNGSITSFNDSAINKEKLIPQR